METNKMKKVKIEIASYAEAAGIKIIEKTTIYS